MTYTYIAVYTGQKTCPKHVEILFQK